MSPRHPNACASRGETNDALRALATLNESADDLVQCILDGAHEGNCDAYQALQASDLGRSFKVLGGLLEAVEAVTATALSGPAAAQEAA